MGTSADKLIARLLESTSPETKDSPGARKLLELINETTEDWSTPERFKNGVKTLNETYFLFNISHNFSVGHIARWKKGLKNRKFPSYDEPVIVVQVLTEPIFDGTEESGSSYFRERLDIVLGVINPDGDFLLFHYDSRRFEPADDLSQ